MKPLLAILPVMVLLASGNAAVSEEGQATDRPSKPHSEARSQKKIERPAIFSALSLLFRLQDGTAAGDADSMNGQKQLLPHLGPELESFFKSASPEQLRLIAPDVSAYVLSGGDPASALSLAQNDSLDRRTRRILEAAAVFMQGDHETAAEKFKDIDTQGLPMRLVGRLALVQALLDGKDAASKQHHLAAAIAAMPGSLIEESALRRSALAYADAHDESRFWERVARYQRRFPKSLYARAFWRDVSVAIIAWSAKDSSFDFGRLDQAWKELEPLQRRGLYLDLTRQAAAANERQVTEFAAARLLSLSAEGSAESQVARLYMSVYKIASPEGDDALRDIKSIQRTLLSAQDRELLNAALAVSGQINRPLPTSLPANGVEKPEPDPLLIRGQSALDDSDKLLEGLPL